MPLPPFSLSALRGALLLRDARGLRAGAIGLWRVRGANSARAVRHPRRRGSGRGLGVRTTPAKVAAFASARHGRHGRRRLGVLHRLHLSAVRGRSADHDRRGADGVSRRQGHAVGAGAGAFILVPAQQYLAYRLGASQLYLVGYSAVFLVVILLLPAGSCPRSPTACARAGCAPAAPRPGGSVPAR